MKLGTQVMFYPEVFLTSHQKSFTAMVILTRMGEASPFLGVLQHP